MTENNTSTVVILWLTVICVVGGLLKDTGYLLPILWAMILIPYFIHIIIQTKKEKHERT